MLITSFLMAMGADLLWASDLSKGFDLTWWSVPDAKAYRVEISVNKNMEPLLFTDTEKATKYVWSPPDVGVYYWRVRAINGMGVLQTPSEVGVLRAVVDSPKLSEQNTKIIRAIEEKDQPIEMKLKWGAYAGVKSYVIETSPSSDFSSIKTYRVENQTEITITSKENLYWRVAALNSHNELISDYSAVGNVQIEDEIPPSKGIKGIDIVGGMYVWKMDSIDANTLAPAKLISTRGFALKSSAKYQLYDRTALDLKLSINHLAVQGPSNKTIRSAAMTYWGTGINVHQRFSKNFNLIFSLDYEQDLYVRALSLNTLTFDSVGIFKFGLGFNKEITKYKSWDISAKTQGRYLAGARGPGYNINGGFAWGVGVEATRKISQYKTGLELGFYQEYQNTAIARQAQSFLGLNLLFSWDLEEKAEK